MAEIKGEEKRYKDPPTKSIPRTLCGVSYLYISSKGFPPSRGRTVVRLDNCGN